MVLLLDIKKQTGDTCYIYRNDLDKACFQHDSAYADNKEYPEYDGYERGLASVVYKFFDKTSVGNGFVKDSSLILADEPVIKKFNKRKVYSQFKDNIWGVDLADIQSLSKKTCNH